MYTKPTHTSYTIQYIYSLPHFILLYYIYTVITEKDEELEEFDEVYTQLTTQVETLEQHILTLQTTYDNDYQKWMAEKEALLKNGGGWKDRPEPGLVRLSVHSAAEEKEILALQHTITTLESSIEILTNKSKSDVSELTALREQKDKYSNTNSVDQGDAVVEVEKMSSKELVDLRGRLALKEEKLVRIVFMHVFTGKYLTYTFLRTCA